MTVRAADVRHSSGVEVQRSHHGVVTVVLSRPRQRNALHDAAQQAVLKAFEDAVQDGDVRVIVLRAEGDHFCSGVDLVQANDPTRAKPRHGHIERNMRTLSHRVIRAVWECQLPVVAVVRGHASGLGCNLALAADFAVVSQTAKFTQPFVGRGFVPDTGGAYFLPRMIGVARAKQMLMLGRTVDGVQAADWGMVYAAVPDERLDAAADELIEELASAATLAVGLSKELLHRALAADLGAAMAEEGFIQELALRSKDFKEGIASFLEHRPANFTGH